MINEDAVRKYRQAGDVVHRVLKHAMDKVHPGMSILELCRLIEDEIRGSGALPAFPANINVNNVAAHYTAKINDESVIPPNSIVKIDVGAHVDGFIVDAAVTVHFNAAYSMLTRAAWEALRNALNTAKAGVELSRIGAVVDKTISGFGFKPIRNLTGHLITRYRLHSGKSVPNYDDGSRVRMLNGEVYAIEPFATNGRGMVFDSPEVTIYMLQRVNVKKLSAEASLALEYIYSNFNQLPFTPRWLVDKFGDRTMGIINELTSRGALYGYSVLMEAGGGFVAQFEDTVIVTQDGVEPLARVLELIN
ncbi:MAG: type II methionyl aminopeptidase [Caldivirga sp.]